MEDSGELQCSLVSCLYFAQISQNFLLTSYTELFFAVFRANDRFDDVIRQLLTNHFEVIVFNRYDRTEFGIWNLNLFKVFNLHDILEKAPDVTVR